MKNDFNNEIEEARKHLINCERLYYIGMSILKETKILIKVLEELSLSANKCVSAYSKLKEKSFSNKSEELKFFIKSHAKNFLSSEEMREFIQIFNFIFKHRETPLEFVRKERLIFYNNGKYEVITKEKVGVYLRILKKIITSLEKLTF
ncbi:MAG: hypothetical protein QW273_00885 [Candidatus Pacearchaeota archaeon]